MMEKMIKGPNFKNVKSKYIVKKIFSFVKEKKKLDLKSYNKQIQKQLDLSIDNYRKKSKIILISEKKGKGKEYQNFSKILIFEGEYKNRKRN